ncbi:hypothetical protein [Virgibacillus litoralis]|uniref:Uncharacterized protein n=1 Tax=Virgibacillus litoralis TaxID=578221 RepID=A0ABS4HFN9_9BACI|nr:hypothetical protein [Virgibacillus litoralis]MBP1949678.1 hypothetical protein [Virgibacillus litoralis]
MSKQNIIYSVAIGILIIFSLLNYVKISNIEDRMQMVDNMQGEVQNVNNSVRNISSQVNSQMDKFLREQLWIPQKEYKITNVDLKENKIDVILEWSLRDLLDEEKLAFLYREEGAQEWTELEVNNKGGLNYSLEHTFPLKGNYETQVIATSADGKRSEDLLNLKFKEQLDNRIMIDAFLHPRGNGQFEVNINIHNRLEQEFMLAENKDDLKVKSAKAYLYVNGEPIKEMDILKRNQGMHSDSFTEDINYHNSYNLKDKIDDEAKVELRVTVEDGLGLKYETIADTTY